jgi:hypothetical protein
MSLAQPGAAVVLASVRRALHDERLLLREPAFGLLDSEIRSLGRALRDGLRDRLGAAGYADLIRMIVTEHPEDDLVRVLGHGHVLTRIAIAPVPLPKPALDAREVGALANLIVAVYDHALDAGARPSTLLSRRELVDALEGADRTVVDSAREDGAPLVLLVREYRRRVDALGGMSECPAIRSKLNEVIVRMYDTENATSVGVPPSRARLRAKNALPFVVLGLPAWLMAPAAHHSIVHAHLRWLYRLGALFGAVDDVADLERDQSSGHPNGIAALLSSGVPPEKVAGAIAQKARSVVNGPLLPDVERQQLLPLMATTITSWLGGAAAV